MHVIDPDEPVDDHPLGRFSPGDSSIGWRRWFGLELVHSLEARPMTDLDQPTFDPGASPTRSDTSIFHLTGEVDLSNAREIDTAASLALAEGATRLVVDLGGVTFMDSQGLRALVVAHRHLAEHDVELTLSRVPPRIVSLLTLTGLDTTFVTAD